MKKKEKKCFFFLKESVGTKLQNPRQELILKRKRKPKNSCFALPFVQQKINLIYPIYIKPFSSFHSQKLIPSSLIKIKIPPSQIKNIHPTKKPTFFISFSPLTKKELTTSTSLCFSFLLFSFLFCFWIVLKSNLPKEKEKK